MPIYVHGVVWNGEDNIVVGAIDRSLFEIVKDWNLMLTFLEDS
jgi:hypothetical protein